MSIRAERLKEIFYTIASEEVLSFTREYPHEYGIISLTEVKISPDKKYCDLFVHGQYGKNKELTQFLSRIAGKIRSRASKELSLRQVPKMRFRIAKNPQSSTNILQTLQELDEKYGLSQ